MDQESHVHFTACFQRAELRARYQHALQAWAKRRQDAWQLGWRGKELSGEVTRLQTEFAKSYVALQKHSRECPFCNLANRFRGLESELLQFAHSER